MGGLDHSLALSACLRENAKKFLHYFVHRIDHENFWLKLTCRYSRDKTVFFFVQVFLDERDEITLVFFQLLNEFSSIAVLYITINYF